jgi:hypothetical protein
VIVGVDNLDSQICLRSSASTDLVVDVVGHVPTQGTLVPVVPARLADTRAGEPTVDRRFEGGGRVPAGGTLRFDTWGRGGVPEGAATVVLNVISVGPDGPGYLTVYPCGVDRPLASNVNYTGSVTTNMAVTSVGADGKVCVDSSAGADVVVDVNAFVPAGSSPRGVVPARLADTRIGQPTVDGVGSGSGRLAAGTTLAVDVTGRGGVPADATTVLLNVAAVAPFGPGHLTVYPCGLPRPLASALNYVPGDIRAVAVPVDVGRGGRACIFTLASTELVVDVSGYDVG